MQEANTGLATLFGEDNTLTLVNGMKLDIGTARELEAAIDSALTCGIACLQHEKALEIVNANASNGFGIGLPRITLVVNGSLLDLQAYTMRLLSFREVAGRLRDQIEVFVTFLQSEDIPHAGDYQYQLRWWGFNIDPPLVMRYRQWLKRWRNVDPEACLKAFETYARFAQTSGHLDDNEFEAIASSIEKPLVNSRRHQK